MTSNTGLPVAVLVASLIFTATAQPADKAGAVLKDGSDKEVGRAELTTTPSGVLIRLDLTDMAPGEHAFHVHAVGKCEPPTSNRPERISIPMRRNMG
jgi:Cu-Zn family superoxide dismutase